jgi:hypothetical protein
LWAPWPKNCFFAIINALARIAYVDKSQHIIFGQGLKNMRALWENSPHSLIFQHLRTFSNPAD